MKSESGGEKGEGPNKEAIEDGDEDEVESIRSNEKLEEKKAINKKMDKGNVKNLK